MSDTVMAEALKKAMTPDKRLYLVGTEALQAFGSPPSALKSFEAALADDAELRRALAMEYLVRLHREMRTPAGRGLASNDAHRTDASAAPAPNGEGEGQLGSDAHGRDAPSSPPHSGGDMGLVRRDAHDADAQPPEPHRAGAGHSSRDAQRSDARPVREPQRQPARTSTAVVQAKKLTGIFAREIGTTQAKLGDLTLFDVRVMERKAIIGGLVLRALATKIAWPDEKTKLVNCASEKQVTEIMSGAYSELDAMKELTHV